MWELKRKRKEGMCVCCWQLKTLARCVLTDVSDVVCVACIVSRWVAGGPSMDMVGSVSEGSNGAKRNIQICLPVCCWRWVEMERR